MCHRRGISSQQKVTVVVYDPVRPCTHRLQCAESDQGLLAEAESIIQMILLFLLLLTSTWVSADPVKPVGIHVVDGDTIDVDGKRIRLIDFDAPELGGHAHCGLERMLAARAASRLRQIIKTGDDIDLQIVECSCRPGTEGTRACNWGRACGYLTVDGHDVGDILIAENLARPYVCGRYSCPKRKSWCPLEAPR
jgi:endonuclease YncB( thermonuclease family)